MTRYFNFTPKAIENSLDVEFFQKDADEILRHHYCDDFELYVSSYATDSQGYLWGGPHFGAAHIRGISVSSNDSATIDWFVRTWVKLNYLVPVIPVTL